ncbi:MAG: AAA family ATPase [Thermoguttaceae bacterium]
MGHLEGFWIRNFLSLKQVGIGSCYPQFNYIDDADVLPYLLGPITIFAGANGTGKSGALDAFSFVADCYRHRLDIACIKRGGFGSIYSHESIGAMSFGFQYHLAGEPDAVTYAVSIEQSQNHIPYIETELLAYRRGKESAIVFFLQNGEKSIRYLAPDDNLSNDQLTQIEFTDYQHLGLAALKSHPKFPAVAELRQFFENCVFSNFTPDPARGLDRSMPRRHESIRGFSLFHLVQYILGRYGNRAEQLFSRIANQLPHVNSIQIDLTQTGHPNLLFMLEGQVKPIPVTLLSDATIRLFTYLILIEEDDPAPLILIEEPENGLDRLHCWKFADELNQISNSDKVRQLLVSTHHPGLADLVLPNQVWVFQKNTDGFTVVERASDSLGKNGPEQKNEPEQSSDSNNHQWFSNNFEERL